MATTVLHPAAPAVRGGLYSWLTTTDHKKIGILYLINSLVFFMMGGLLALLPEHRVGEQAGLVDAAEDRLPSQPGHEQELVGVPHMLVEHEQNP